jgi:hypothetical protein
MGTSAECADVLCASVVMGASAECADSADVLCASV